MQSMIVNLVHAIHEYVVMIVILELGGNDHELQIPHNWAHNAVYEYRKLAWCKL